MSWLTLAALVFPLICYLLLFLHAKKTITPLSNSETIFSGIKNISFIASVLVASISLVTVLLTIFSSNFFEDNTRIVWRGVKTNGELLRVGGPKEEAIIAWPNGSFSPEIKITNSKIEVSGGGFVYDEKEKKYLNGNLIAPGNSTKIRDYTIKVEKTYFPFFGKTIYIFDKDNNLQAEIGLTTYFWSNRQRVRSLKYLIENNNSQSLLDLEVAGKFKKVEYWATDVLLLQTDTGDLYFLDSEDRVQTNISFPAKLSIVWPKLKLPIEITNNANSLEMEFLPPWRYASQIPQHVTSKDVEIKVTANPLPDENVFLLPFGRGIKDPRKSVYFSRDNNKFIPAPSNNEDNKTEKTPPMGVRTATSPTSSLATSEILVNNDNYSFVLNTTQDVPSQLSIFLRIALAFVCLVLGLMVVFPQMPTLARWVVYALAVALWNILCFRLILSLRYAADPTLIDILAVKGVSHAFAALSIVPGLILLLTKMQYDQYLTLSKELKIKCRIYAIAYLTLLIISCFLEYYTAPYLWANLPQRYFPSIGLFNVPIILLIIVYLFLYTLFSYRISEKSSIYNVLAYFWLFPQKFITKSKEVFWSKRFKEKGISRFTKGFAFLIFILACCLLTLFGRVLTFVIPVEIYQEIVVGFIFYWLPALFWISSKLTFVKSDNTSTTSTNTQTIPPLFSSNWKDWLLILWYAVLTILGPIFCIPVLIGDVGSVLAVLTVFFSLTAVLLCGRAYYTGLVTLTTLTIVFFGAGLIYQNLDFFLPILPGKASVRLLNFKESTGIQKYILRAAAIKGEEGLPYQELLNGYQHTWESKAIAHEGGTVGLGFGNAPTRRSFIRQDTLQYDTAFSFFVISEYGFLGGLLLLILYATPLIIILLSGYDCFEAGHALAVLITSAFLLEALFHAGMNLGAFPLTGRCLPFTTVNSLTDLIRWTLLFCFASQAIFWRYNGRQRIVAVSLITPQQQTPVNFNPSTSNQNLQHHVPERFSQYLIACLIMVFLPVVFFFKVSWQGWQVINDDKEYEEFNYQRILDDVKYLIEKQIITFDSESLKINIDRNKMDVSNGQLIMQQIAQFNALETDEKINEIRQENMAVFNQELAQVKNLSDYARLLDKLRKNSSFGQQKRKVTLFRVKENNKQNDKDGTPKTKYLLEPNPDFNVHLSFRVNLKKEDIPEVSYQGGDSDKDKKPPRKILGPAWVMGRWVTAYDSDVSIPWMKYLRNALEAEWKNLGAKEAKRLYSNLTLEQLWQENALKFMESKGQKLHEELLKSGYPDKLPPRVAMSVINLPGGQTLALGGWPHMTSTPFWKNTTVADLPSQWVPTVEWLEQEAPKEIKIRYGGERNFDRSLVMGSSTKPLWAAASLVVHPNLDKQLRVRGGDSEETDIFDINITGSANTWDVHRTSWIDFKTYLADSDNRYHVRLGFLGLAEKDGEDVVASGPSKANKKAEKESLNANVPKPWNQYPSFPTSIAFNQDNSKNLTNLHETTLAKNLENMFSITTTVEKSNEKPNTKSDYQISFWTKNEYDDLIKKNDQSTKKLSSLFNVISPQNVNFELDKTVSTPRDYVSLLLGGRTNAWANVDFAAAFATCITGQPIIPHIVSNNKESTYLNERKAFPEIAQKLHPGLKEVVTKGTATKFLTNAISYFKELPDVEVFAKTGTLSASNGGKNTSRIVLALIRWKDKSKGLVDTGLVFSFVGEDAGVGTTTTWLNEFIENNKNQIDNHFSIKRNGSTKEVSKVNKRKTNK